MGYVEARYEKQNLENAREEYVLSLIQWGFLQKVVEDEFGCITSFRMHDLIHDLALFVSGLNYTMVDSHELEERVGHVSFSEKVVFKGDLPPFLLKTKEELWLLLVLGSYGPGHLQLKELSRFQCLRALRLRGIRLEEVPSSISRLIHLRYLNQSNNYFRNLPK